MSEVNIGIVTDTHAGNYDGKIARTLKEKEVDAIAFLGDAVMDFTDSKKKHAREIENTIRTFDGLDIPVFWIPGNYEDFAAYDAVFKKIEDDLDDVIDVSRLGAKVDFKGHDLVFIPGSSQHTRGFHVTDKYETGPHLLAMVQETKSGLTLRGKSPIYVFNPNDLTDMVENPEKTVFFAHHPCKFGNGKTIDLAIHADYMGQRIVGPNAHRLIMEGKAEPVLSYQGDGFLSYFLQKKIGIENLKFISGDIHEAAVITDAHSNPINEGKFSKQLFANPGPGKEWDYGILTLRDDNTAAMKRFNVFGEPMNHFAELLKEYGTIER